MTSTLDFVQQQDDYAYGFTTNVETDSLPKGLTEATVRGISQRKGEPAWLLEFRLDAFKRWQQMEEPIWADVSYPEIDYQDITYYTAPKNAQKKQSLDEVDPELLATFAKLGIPLNEQKRLSNVAVDAVFDSVSIATTFKKDLAKHGVIFCSLSEALETHEDVVRQYLGSVVPVTDNFFSALNAAVFTEGSFVYIPEGVTCPMDLSTYFRINTEGTGQFERTLIIAEKGSKVSYLEGCTAPQFDSRQLHAAVVELIALDDAEIKYSTVQNWFAGDPKTGAGGIYNFVTKRAHCKGKNSRVFWTQVETGSAITWKYPSCILSGEGSIGEFYSVALTNNFQEADTGTKMIHIGKNTRSRIVSKGISAGKSKNNYRGAVVIKPGATNARNFTQCDSMLIGRQCKANTYPAISVENATAVLEHEASTSRISEDQLFYFQSRGIAADEAVSTIVNGFCQTVFNELPAEFAAEATQLLSLKLEHSVG